jgi:hypothetical protein
MGTSIINKKNKEELSINSFYFFIFSLKKIETKPSDFCKKNGWNVETYLAWKSTGVPKRAWIALRQEVTLYNLLTFRKKCDDDIVYWEELKQEYIESRKELE